MLWVLITLRSAFYEYQQRTFCRNTKKYCVDAGAAKVLRLVLFLNNKQVKFNEYSLELHWRFSHSNTWQLFD